MSKPIRILHVLGRLDRGGAETMIMNIYRNIDRNKIQFDFIVHTADECAYDEEIIDAGGHIFNVPRFSLKNSIRYIIEWSRFFQKHQEYKIIHSHVRSTATIFLLIAKLYGLKTIIHSHSVSNGRGIISRIKTILSYPLRYICDYYFACSNEAGKWLFGENIMQGDRFFLLNNAIDSDLFKFKLEKRDLIRKQLNIENKFVIGHVGRFCEVKNHIFLIEIFNEICLKNSNAVLLLIGNGELRKDIEQKVIDFGIEDNVMFLGVREDIPDILQVMDVFLFPSLFEGLGMVLIEAQVSGLKCIISETIPKEVEITDLIRVISLNDPPQHWADIILTSPYERYSRQAEIIDAGYEIKTTARWLEKIYSLI